MINCVWVIAFLVALSSPDGYAEPESPAAVRVVEESGATILVLDGIPRYSIVEGDILVPLESQRATFDTDLWDGGIVRYEFDSNVPASKRALMLSAFATMEQIAAVQFVEGMGTFDNGIAIESTSSDDCPECDCVNNATVGETHLGHVNICNWGSTRTLLHELGHVLNLWHEQSRPDRDAHVRINFGNVPDDQHHNFEVQGGASVYGPYDFASLMHYGQCFFSECSSCPNDGACPDGGRTIVVLPPYDLDWQNSIGTATDLSDLDRLTLSFLYPQADWRFVNQAVCDFCESVSCVANSFFCRAAGPGNYACPACTFTAGYNDTPAGGTVWVQPGTYAAVGSYSKQVRVEAPLGGVILGG